MIRFLLSRPTFSIALSMVIALFGLVCFGYLPIEHLPNLSPPAISITTELPGADAETLALSVAEPLERAIIGTENMIYMSSESATPSSMSLTAYFLPGTDPIQALNNIQKQVDAVKPNLPEQVRKGGIQVAQQSSGILLLIAIQDQSKQYDPTFLTNFATIHLVPRLQAIPGVNTANVLNGGEYSMRIWLKPDRLAQFNLSPADVRDAILEQNALYSIGEIGQEPAPPNTKLTLPVSARGLLTSADDFGTIILKADSDGSTVLLKDVSRVELGAENYNVAGTLNGEPATFISIKQDPNSNALKVAKQVREKMAQFTPFLPEGVSYSIPYDTTKYIKISIQHVAATLIGAAILVSVIIYLFLHTFLAALIPIIAMIVSVIGTFLGMYLLGYSINVLTLFGMVLAIGIVVDDAIIVVEKVEFNLKTGALSSKEAAVKAMQDLAAPIVAIVFALFSVFLPVTFMSGVTAQIYKQFAVTIVIAVVISGFVALTLSPVLCVLFFKKKKRLSKLGQWVDQAMAAITEKYLQIVDWLMNHRKTGIAIWFLALGTIAIVFHFLPMGLIPTEDQGVLIISAQLPDGASLARTKTVSSQIEQIIREEPGVKDYIAISGNEGANSAIYYVALKDWNQRKGADLQAAQILKKINGKLREISDARAIGYNLPPIPQVADSDMYQFWIVNQGQWSSEELQNVVDRIIEAGKKRKEFSYIGTMKSADILEMKIDVNKVLAKALGVKIDDLFYTLQVLFGSVYVNDFKDSGRLFKVIMQAESSWRSTLEGDFLKNMFIRSSSQQMVSLKSLIGKHFSTQPANVNHYNGYPAKLISVGLAASPEKVISTLEEVAAPLLPPNMMFEWSGTAYEARNASKAVYFALFGGILVLFLCLAALYGRWILPFAVLLAIPFGILGALLAILSRGMPMDLYFQVGLIASIGISAKNAILIIEGARVNREKGMGIFEAARAAAQVRFRPIILTSLSLILAVFPLTISTGAGAASQHSMGTGVLGGMFLATLLGIFFVPFFFRLLEREGE